MNRPERIVVFCPFCGDEFGSITYIAGVQQLSCKGCSFPFFAVIDSEGQLFTYEKSSEIPDDIGYKK
jgi:hypothetical protein